MKIRRSGWLFKTLGSLIVAGLFAASPGLSFAKDQSDWRFYMYTPPGHHYTRIMKEMSADIAAQTKDKLKITVVTAGEVPYNPTQVLAIVKDGFVDGGEAVPDFVAGSLPVLNLTNLPMLFTSLEELKTGMKHFEPVVKEALKGMNQDLLYWHFASTKNIFGRGNPIKNLSDLKGKRVRAFGLVDSEFLRRLGAIPVAMPNTEVPQALERGVIDAFIASAQFTVGSKWDELINWAYLIDFTTICCYDTINSKSIKSLPPDVGSGFFEVAGKYQDRWHGMVTTLEGKAREKMAAAGIVLTSASEADRQKAREIATPYWTKWAESVGPKAVQALDEVRKSLNK